MNKINIEQFCQKHKLILIVLFLALVLHLVFLPGFHELWWDSGVYAGMGKHIFSAGNSGLWEHIRPPVLPFMLGLLWVLKLDIISFGEILQLLLSLGSILLVYLITRHYFDEHAAIFSSIIFAFSSIFFYLSFHLYSEIPAVFFVLLSIYFFTIKRFYFSGFFAAIAFLSKFPAGIFIIALGLVLLVNKDFRSILKLGLGFATPLIPVLIIYQIFYGNALLPFIEAREVILNVLGCNVLRYKPWWHYFHMILTDNYLNAFALLGLIVYFVQFRKARLLPLFMLLLPLFYFSQMHCRDYRYLAVFIPFVAMFTGFGLAWAASRIKKFYWLLLLIVLGASVFTCSLYFIGNEVTSYGEAEMGYFTYLQGKEISGELWSSNPVISFFTDAKINKIYYPVYNKGVSTTFSKYLKDHTDSIQYVLLDNCGGGIICPPDEPGCEKETDYMIDFLEANFEKVYDKKQGRCWYLIFQN